MNNATKADRAKLEAKAKAWGFSSVESMQAYHAAEAATFEGAMARLSSTEVCWVEGMKSTWKSKVVRTQAALDRLLEKLADKGATDIRTRAL